MKHTTLTTYILSLFDLAYTLYLTTLYGVQIEANPVGVAILTSPIGVAYKVIGVGLCLWVLYRQRARKAARIGLSVCLIAYTVLALYHIVILAALTA